jgi:hypothetical protein
MMTGREITSLALKLFAIYMLVQMILAIPTLIASLVTAKDLLGSDFSALWLWGAAAAAVVVGLVVAVFLWKVASKALANPTDGIRVNVFSDIEAAVFAALGLFLVVQALVRFSYVSAGAYVQYVRVEPGEVSLQTSVLMVAHILQGLVGLSLILRTDGWVSLFRRLRNAGVSS